MSVLTGVDMHTDIIDVTSAITTTPDCHLTEK